MRQRPRMNPQSGLSLTELLVALTVMAFVTGLATQGLWTGVRVWERGRDHATEGARAELVR
ncbi:MAG: PulJ/GspJ family protein, partial [bacterium]